jgi:ferric-dicitrate binding protein FerR (iron transport regulator)
MSVSTNMTVPNKNAQAVPTGGVQGTAEYLRFPESDSQLKRTKNERPEVSSEENLLESEDFVWMMAMKSLREVALDDPECTREALIRRGRSGIARGRALWASLTLCFLAALFIAMGLGMRRDVAQPVFWTRYETDVQLTAPVPLKDGSVAQMNTRAQMRVNLTGSVRQVVLDSGEVFFDVSPDASRPFDVKAGPVKIRAIGTAFSVRKNEDGQVEAAVRHGVVELEPVKSPDDSSGASAQPPEVKPGQVATIDAAGKISVADVGREELARQLAWANPLRRFDGMTLQEAVDLFNQYNVRKLAVKDAELARMRITGGYHLTEPEKFVESLQRMGINHVMQGLESSGDARILLLRK